MTEEEARKRKVEERKAKRAEQVAKSKTTSRKRNLANTAPPTEVYPKRNRVQGGAAYRETNTNNCCVCFGQNMTLTKRKDALYLVASGFSVI